MVDPFEAFHHVGFFRCRWHRQIARRREDADGQLPFDHGARPRSKQPHLSGPTFFFPISAPAKNTTRMIQVILGFGEGMQEASTERERGYGLYQPGAAKNSYEAKQPAAWVSP